MFFFFSLLLAQAEVGYYRQPSSDGVHIVFVAEDDLWIVPIEGGEARRLVHMDGVELNPLFSEDGKYLFWTSQAEGNREVYKAKLYCCGFEKSIPIQQWERLSWREGEDVLLGFGEKDELLIRNLSQAPFYRSEIEVLNLKTLSIHRLGEKQHQRARQGNSLLWQDVGTDWQIWKQYRGGLAPEIWLQVGAEKQNISNWVGEDIEPFWVQKTPYFLSDRQGRMGLFSWKNKKIEQIFVSENWDLHSPKPMPNGKIIAELGGEIIEIDPETKDIKKIPIALPAREKKTTSFLLGDYINQVVGTKEAILIQYRGFVDQVSSSGEWKNLGLAEYIDSTGDVWIQNGQLVIKNGFEEDTILKYSKGFDLVGAPSKGADWIVARSQDLSLWLFSVTDDEKPILLQKNIRFPIEDFSWSKDGRQLVFTGIDQKGNQGIYHYNTETREKKTISQDFSHQHDPVWFGEQNEIVFLSSSEISLQTGKDNQNHIVVLEDRVVKYNQNGELERLNIPVGSYQDLKIREEQFFLLSQEGELFRYDLRDYSWQSLQQDVKSFKLEQNREILVWKEEQISWIDWDGRQQREIYFAAEVRSVDIDDEWRRIFEATVRLVDSSFAEKERLPKDWEQRVIHYQKLLPRLRSRTELNELLKELVGDLETSHLMVFGGVEHPFGARNASIGADVEWRKNAWVITKVYNSGIELPFRLTNSVEGMCIREIDGEKMQKGAPIGKYLTEKDGKKISLTIQDCDKKEPKKEIRIRGLSTDQQVKEMDWMLQNRTFVDEQTNGKVGYIHLPNLMEEGLGKLERWIDVENKEKGIIIDLRYNGGGYYEVAALERIFLAEIGQFRWANGQLESFPYRSKNAPKRVFLINGATQSAGEGLGLGAKSLGATLVGTRTWGGYSSFARIKLPDGGIVGVTTVIWKDDDIENRGIEPDIMLIEEQEQLEKAIEVLLSY